MTTTAYSGFSSAVVIVLYVLFGALTADVAYDEAKAVGSPAPFGSLFIIAAIWPVMLAARIVYRFVRKLGVKP